MSDEEGFDQFKSFDITDKSYLRLTVNGVYRAVFEGNLHEVQQGIEKGHRINERLPHSSQFSLLHLAVMKDNIEILEYLLSREGVFVNIKCYDDRTPVMLAAELGCFESAERLVQAGADLDVYNDKSYPLLHMSQGSLKICQLLIRHGADIDIANDFGGTLLHEAVCNKRLEIMHMLLYYNADPNIVDLYGRTPFMEALACPSLEAQEALLDYVDDFNRTSYDGKKYGSTLSLALCTNSPFTKDIIERGADVNYGDDPRDTSAFSACLQNSVDPSTFKMVWERLRYNETKIDFFRLLNYREVVPTFLQVIIESDNFELATEFLCTNSFRVFVFVFATRRYALEQLTALTCRLIEYGFHASSYDIDAIFSRYGYCELFRLLLYMDNDFTRGWLPHMALVRLMFDIDYDLESAVDEADDIPRKNVVQLLEYSICPRLIDALTVKYSDDEGMIAILGGLPRVPSLIQLARNAARKHVWRAFKIADNCQFYTTIDHLDMPTLYKNILTFRKKIYRVVQ